MTVIRLEGKLGQKLSEIEITNRVKNKLAKKMAAFLKKNKADDSSS